MELKHREIQTRIKHEILSQYLDKWYSIITIGMSRKLAQNPKLKEDFRARFIYVDYFSYMGSYEDNGVAVDGSPVIGIRALDTLKTFFAEQTGGLVPMTAAILFEDDPAVFKELITTLTNLGWQHRLKRLDKNETLRDGDIGLICDDSSKYVDRVLKYIEAVEPTFSFHFIDPFGAKAVERKNVERIVASKRADCIINMMLDPIYRFIVPAAQEDARPAEQAKAEYYDKFFGSPIWREVARELDDNTLTRPEAEQRLVTAFNDILAGADDTLGVKRIRLKFEEGEQTYYHLFLTTHDSTGAFRMNEILWQAELRQYDYREEQRRMKEHAEQDSFDFFGEMKDEKRPVEPQPDLDYLADSIYAKCKGQTLTFKKVLDAMINTAYFERDMRNALGKLREQKRASFEGAPSAIPNKTAIKFA